ncbi:septal ring lytic transglycosylase RlpA family protein [Streptomyces sp. C10-9-1]|uniref:septal ring lytic transglycosylase RlpA family protein n=1 Tax=Streptomyces sp. C10-9-1 TaxID=1859285 RepID=UPI00211133AE|nr:septal ring lytic transglycosylase RlpA family protein [Streptomyces sp. C10-9-1]MCQ6553521.1 septal ring lytic transglycosylase RlpA family protein [Streptomyces sp. C10-9-1]
MSRKKTLSGKKKLALLVGAAAMVGGTAIVMTGTSQASVACDGLAQAIRNNENFIAGQRANPDAQSAARIANREAVIAQIRVQQEAAGCASGGGQAAPPAQQAPPEDGAGEQDGGQEAGAGQGGNAGGEVVCAGSTVTLSGEGGAPAASSGEFPVGTRLKVTNLDNGKSTTVEVTSPSGSCALLNNAAFEQVREPGKFLIRNARIERVG